MKKIGIIGAMDEEIELLLTKINISETIDIAKMKFYCGIIQGKDVVLVRCGIGKVNASICTQILISKFQVTHIINTGVAGAIHDELNIGDLVISKDVIQHDFNARGFGYKQGEIPRLEKYIFESDNQLIDISQRASKEILKDNKALVGTILSGDIFVASPKTKEKLWNEFNGYCTEMEGAAIGHTCYLNDVPFVILRSMSDKADGSAHNNFNEFVDIAAKNSSLLIEKMVELI